MLMRRLSSRVMVLTFMAGAWCCPAVADLTTGDADRPTLSDPNLSGGNATPFSPGTSVTDDGGGTFYSPPPIEHDTPETASKPTTVGKLDPGRLEPVMMEATQIDHARVDDPDVLIGPTATDTGLWKTLQEVQLNPLTVVAGSLLLTVVVVGMIVAISRHGARERQRRLVEAGPPVYFEGDVTFEADRDALAKHEQQNDGQDTALSTPAPEAGPRRSESGLRY